MDVAVHMDVPRAVMFVLVRVDLESFAQRPAADADQHDADETFAPGGDELNRDQITQPKREQPDDTHAGGMANAPAHTRNPGLFWPPNGQWSDSRQVIRPCQNMGDAVDQSCQRYKNHNISAFAFFLGGGSLAPVWKCQCALTVCPKQPIPANRGTQTAEFRP